MAGINSCHWSQPITVFLPSSSPSFRCAPAGGYRIALALEYQSTGPRSGSVAYDVCTSEGWHGLTPYRLDRYLASNDPALGEKAADSIELNMHTPLYTTVFWVNENIVI